MQGQAAAESMSLTQFFFFFPYFFNSFKLYMNMSLKIPNNIDEIKALLDPLSSLSSDQR